MNWKVQDSGLFIGTGTAQNVHTVTFPYNRPAVLRGEMRFTVFDREPGGDDDNLFDTSSLITIGWYRDGGTFTLGTVGPRPGPLCATDQTTNPIVTNRDQMSHASPGALISTVQTDDTARTASLRLSIGIGWIVRWTFGYTIELGNLVPS